MKSIKFSSIKCNKELDLTHSKSKAQCWQTGLIWVFIVTFGIINFGCDKKNEKSVIDQYYVKYEVNSYTIYSAEKLSVTISNEIDKMTIIIDKKQLWETVIGPVQKGFIATLNVVSQSGTAGHTSLYTNIYVSKNGSPFALKKNDGSDTPRESVQINYTINY
jgi:hypothetical protein